MSRADIPASRSTTYANIMIPVDFSEDSTHRMQLAVGLADKFSCQIIGVAAREINPPLYFETPTAGIASIIDIEERDAKSKLAEAEVSFRQALGECRGNAWRQALANPTTYLLEQSRIADLIIVGSPGEASNGDSVQGVNGADIVMGAGRPVLLVPPGTSQLEAKRVVIAWKDTREARRAVWDALAFLKGAQEVFIAAEPSAITAAEDLADYLGRHNVSAIPVDGLEDGRTSGDHIIRIARRERADLIVCGAYGHARAREWVFGGVTQDLINKSSVCCLMSH